MKNKIIHVRITASRKKKNSYLKNPENQKTLGKEFRGITIPSCTFLLMVKLLAYLDLILEKLMKKTKILKALRVKIFSPYFLLYTPSIQILLCHIMFEYPSKNRLPMCSSTF